MPDPSAARIFNFSAGPATLPLSALEEARRDLLCFPGAGASVMELSHRGPVIEGIFQETEARLRRLLSVPEGYHVLFLQGGATMQFSMVPWNFLGSEGADYLEVGSWSGKAIAEARKSGEVRVAWSGRQDGFRRMPGAEELAPAAGASYLHLTSNETIEGIELHEDPELPLPLVCDASSDLLSRPMDVSRYGLIYAGAQKNMGPAGVTVVLLQDAFLQTQVEEARRPVLLDYRPHVRERSLYNTAPVFSVYMVGLVLKWLEDEIGGLQAMLALNRSKAALLYSAIDSSGGFYRGHAALESRSLMNVTWRLPSEAMEKEFVREAEALGLAGLKGHRSVGGIRASIYNAFPVAGVEALVEFMEGFRRRHGS